jgi:ketose-bisphosphate aldolase
MSGAEVLADLRKAQAAGRALAAINVYDTVQALAVADAAHSEQARVILQTGSSSFALLGETPLIAAALTVRASAGGLLNVHLDHCRELDQVRRCLDAGYDSVMFDASHLSLEDNIAQTRSAVELAHLYGAWVEGELGALPGHEDRTVESGTGVMTDPVDAARFVESTAVDLLAVAVGNVHGLPAHPVHLSLERLAEIRRAVDVPLALHGASGLPDHEVLGAIELGVCKINVNTEVRRAYLAALRDSLSTSVSDDLASHFCAARVAASDVVRSKIRLFAGTQPIQETRLSDARH